MIFGIRAHRETCTVTTLLILLVAVAMVLTGQLAQAEKADKALTISIANVNGDVGQVAQVPITIDHVESAGPVSMVLRIEFDHLALTFVTAELPQSLIDSGKAIESNLPEDGRLNVVISGGGGNVTQDSMPPGLVATISFNVDQANDGDTLTLQHDATSAADWDAEPFNLTLYDGAIQIGCPQILAPMGVTATTDLNNRVDISWNEVVNADGYQIYRSTSSSSASAVPISGVVQGLSYSDATAQSPQTVSTGGCTPGTSVVTTKYYYWVKARNDQGCGSAFSASARGYIPAGSKTVKSIAEAALPPRSPDATRWITHARQKLAIRFTSLQQLDPETVQGNVTALSNTSAKVTWQGNSSTDGWVVYQPQSQWSPGETVTFSATIRTSSGARLDEQTLTFQVADPLNYSKCTTTCETAETSPSTMPDDAVGDCYTIVTDGPLTEAITVWLPVPSGVSAADLELFYYHRDDKGADTWFQANNVDAWLWKSTVIKGSDDEGDFVEFTVTHGGTVQLALSPRITPQQSASIIAIDSNLWITLFVVLALWLCGRYRMARNNLR